VRFGFGAAHVQPSARATIGLEGIGRAWRNGGVSSSPPPNPLPVPIRTKRITVHGSRDPLPLSSKGAWRRDGGGQGERRVGPRGCECVTANAAVDVLQRTVWETLLSRIGDAAMLHLLSHAFIFWPLPNGCYLQLAGAPLYRCLSPSCASHPVSTLYASLTTTRGPIRSATVRASRGWLAAPLGMRVGKAGKVSVRLRRNAKPAPASRARLPPPVSFLGYAKSSLGDAESSLGDAESSLGDAESSLGDAKSSLGDAESSLGDAKSSLGDAESSLGDAESSLGDV
jgi:hypothetical protein